MPSIYVGNLSVDATEKDIRATFELFGHVDSVNIISDRETGQSRGFAFVEMKDQDEAQKAIEAVNLCEIAGRAVTVNEARPRNGGDRKRGRRKSW